MFKETSEGQTHSENDGCGMPEHNKANENRDWKKDFDKEFPYWAKPQLGAGKELGVLAGTGMYMQYNADVKKRDNEILEIKKFIETLLIKILAKMETAEDARECRHILKDYILNEKI